MKLLRLVAVLCCAVSIGGCSAPGLGGTTLQATSSTSEGFRFDDANTVDHDYFQMSDINVCTDGDDPVTVTGVRLTGAGAPGVIAFRVSRSKYDDGSAGSSRLSKTPVSDESGPSEPFTQDCGDDEQGGRTFLTVDVRVGELPFETDGIEVSYRTGGDDKTVVLDVPVVLCGGPTGCPPEAGEDDM